MRFKGPYVTLLAGAALAGVLVGLSFAATRINTPAPASTNPAAGTTGTGSATPTPTQPSPTPSAPPPVAAFEATYAGSVSGGGASLAVVVKNGRAVAYLCDGRRIEAWFQGTAVDGKLALAGKSGSSLAGTYDGSASSGTVDADGRSWRFRLKAVVAPSGLYRVSADTRNQLDAAWIVDEEQNQTGVARLVGAAPQPAPRLNTGTLTAQINGRTVQVRQIDGANGTG